MSFKSKKTSLVILGIISLVCSRVLFIFFNDPEGPNLLIVIGMAGILYVLSLAVYAFNSSGPKKFLFAILIQILVVIGLYFLLS